MKDGLEWMPTNKPKSRLGRIDRAAIVVAGIGAALGFFAQTGFAFQQPSLIFGFAALLGVPFWLLAKGIAWVFTS